MTVARCNYCRKSDVAPLFPGMERNSTCDERFEVVQCNNCGLVFTYPQATEEQLPEVYDELYYGKENIRFVGIIENFIHFLLRFRIRKILPYVSKGSILEIGCGRGDFLYELKKIGWDIHGNEISELSAQKAQKLLGDRIIIGSINEKFEDSFFDVVIIYHVLEHLPDPMETLKEIARIIKKDGLLLIAVPNMDSILAKIFKTCWFGFGMAENNYYFSRKTLGNYLSKTGFLITKERHFSLEHDPFGALQSMLNLLDENDNYLYNRFHASSWGEGHHLRNILTIAGGTLLFPIAFLLSLYGALTKQSTTLEVYARKV